MKDADAPALLTSGDYVADRRYAYGDGAFRAGDFTTARDLFQQTLERMPNWWPARFALGKAQLALGERHEAIVAFEAALAHDPQDQLGIGLYLHQAMAEGEGRAAMSPAYIAALFDEYAPRFEHHLTGQLGYCVPVLIDAALAEIAARRGQPLAMREVLDLGCGTGLMMKALAGRVERASGVDLSAGMLREARRLGLYFRLEQADLDDFLAREAARSADLVLAADVFCYIADLEGIFRDVARVLRPGGYFAFSTQSHAGGGAVLGADFRFHHAPAWIETLAREAGFVQCLFRPVTVRLDRDRPVPGDLVVLQALGAAIPA